MAINSAAIGRVIAHGASDAEAQAQAQAGGPTAARTAMLRGGPPGGSPAGGSAQGTGSSAAESAASAPGGQAGGESSEGQGVLAKVGAALGAVVSAEQSLSTLLSGIPMPAFPAARITDWAFGIPHAHSHPPNLIPPAPPIPLPATGPIIKIPYVSGADKVLINGLPAARCGDMGVNIWCGGYFPFYEIFLGSSSVWIEGARAARLGVDMTKHCIFSTPKPNDLPLGPMIGAIVQASPNVIIGGVPLPSLTNLAVGAAFKLAANGFGKVVKAVRAAEVAAAAEKAVQEAAEEAAGKAAQEAAEQAAKEAAEKAAKETAEREAAATAAAAAKKAEQEAAEKSAKEAAEREAATAAELRPVEERPCVGEPIDTATGAVTMEKIDINLPGALELQLKRTYASDLDGDSCFGPRWRCTWGQWVEVHNEVAVFYSDDGRTIRFVIDAMRADQDGWWRNPLVDKVRLRRDARGFAVRDAQRRIRHFERKVNDRWLLTRIEDANGNNIQFSHDIEGALRAVAHSGGYNLRIEATRWQIHRIELIDGDGQSIELMRYEYDRAGRLTAVIDGSGKPFRYQYDSCARVTRWQDRERTWYTYRYDKKGRCVEAYGPDGMYHYRLSYDEATRTTRSVDSLGGVTISEHNKRLQLVRRTDPRGGVTRILWDSHSNKLQETDPEGRTSKFRYDHNGNLLTFSDPLNQTTELTYNALALPVTVKDPIGNIWIRSYDERGNLLSAGLQDGAVWQFEHDGRGNVARVIDPEGRTRELSHDKRGLLILTTDWRQHRAEYGYDAQGRLSQAVDRLGRTTLFAHNALGKVVQVTDPVGSQFNWEYDTEGNVVRRTGAGGHVKTYRYGFFDLLKEVRETGWGHLLFEYDTEARLVAVQNGRRETYTYNYNSTGQIIAEQDFTGRCQKFDYDASGLCIRKINGQGQEMRFERNACGQLVRRRSSDEDANFQYDACCRLVATRNGSIGVFFDRDAYGRVVREVQGSRYVESQFDLRGLRTKRKTSSYNEVGWRHDDNGQMTRQEIPVGGCLEFVLDDAGREVERRMSNGIVMLQQFDLVDRLTKQIVVSGAEDRKPIVEHDFVYNVSGNPIEISDSVRGRSLIEYDSNDRIVAACRERGANEEFTYNHLGDIVSSRIVLSGVASDRAQLAPRLRGRRYGPGARLEQNGNTTYIYDGDGRVIEKHEGLARWQYDWTIGGQLRSLRSPNGERWTYEYDSLGRRVKKSGPGDTTEYLWDGEVVAEEIRDSSTVSWTYRLGTFVPLTKSDGSGTYACVTDQAGTPRELVTDSGQIAWSARLSVWGETEDESGITTCSVRFQGQRYDAESGLHYNFHRYYDPEIGQYLSPDPIGLLGGTRSYGYVHNPLSWVDPLGLAKGDPLPPGSVVHRIGGGDVNNLELQPAEKALNPAGFSVLEGGSPEEASAQMLEQFPDKAEKAKTVGSATAEDIRKAGFDAIEWETKRFPNHARVIHPEGAAGFSPENRAKLAEAFKNTKCG
jgi:RHS repeat-associated protein